MNWRMVGATLLTLCALGCAANPRVAEPAAPLPEDAASTNAEAASQPAGMEAGPTSARIQSISAQNDAQSTLVTIKSDHPLSYTSYDPDSSTLVLEVPDADVTGVEPTIPINSPHLAHIEVSSVEGNSGARRARLQFVGRNAANTRIEPRGEDLVVVLEGPSGPAGDPASAGDAVLQQAPEGAGAQDQEPAASEPPSVEEPAATRLTGIEVTGDDAAPVILLKGDGRLVYTTLDLNDPPRLVVDVEGVTNEVLPRKVSVNAHNVRQIRTSQFKTQPVKVARVVFDLNKPMAYAIEPVPQSLAVSFLPPLSEPGAQPQPVAEARPEDQAPRESASSATPAGEPSVQSLAALPAAPVASQTAASDVRPASSTGSLKEVGQDVVLFDRSEPAAPPASGMPKGMEKINMTTLPPTAFESRTIAGGKKIFRGEKISVAFRDADLREVMFFFADVMKMNVVLDPDVAGKVDIRLNQVPWDQAFQVILKNQGLDAIEDDNVVRIAKTSKLRQEAADLRALKQAQEQAVDPVTFTRTLSYAKVADAMTVLQQVKTDRGRIVADLRTNTLVISDVPDKRTAYDGLLDALDTQTPQVVIEARIVEAIRSYERDLGINWSLAGRATPELGTATNLQFPHRIEFDADVNTAPLGFPSAGGIGLSLGNVLDSFTLDIALEAFEADGKVRILSSPKVVTQNNQPASIEQGVQIPVVTTTATEVDVQYVPASLRLIVTPQITAEDTVIMKVKVENNQPSSTVSVADVPGIVTESVDTQILVRTGTTAVIGGVYKMTESENETGIPGLRRIPFFGWLFKNKVNRKDSSELLVFLTPKIVKNI
ncbi:MAG TPA: type IV pilus secretin PilQ [Candidatus Polarisedimenticolia bacterium]|nr:type IV pilus secretin PilQ [Candidatus Polarisedimenticolia bacterium]